MVQLERQMIEVDGATLEVFVGDDHGPLVCEAHPFGGYTGHLTDADGSLNAVQLIQVNGRGAGHSSGSSQLAFPSTPGSSKGHRCDG